METIVGSRFRMKRKIGAGSFGEIYSGEDVKTGQEVAIKLETNKTKFPQLNFESKLYTILSNGVNIPKHYWYGQDATHNIMVIDLLSKSTEDLFTMCGRKFTLKTVLMLADQMINALEYCHHRHFLHRDVKPDNFMIGSGSNVNQLYLIDFGLSKKYRDPTTLQHIPYSENKSLTGTARYASINALRGIEQSRRDDLESLGYIWVYMLKGTLPWMGLAARDRKQKYERICTSKMRTPLEELCAGLPEEFTAYLQKVRGLRFTEEPNYAEYREMFRALFIKQGFTFDWKYDWSEMRRKASAPTSTATKTPRPDAHGAAGRRDPIIHNSRLVPVMGQEPTRLKTDRRGTGVKPTPLRRVGRGTYK